MQIKSKQKPKGRINSDLLTCRSISWKEILSRGEQRRRALPVSLGRRRLERGRERRLAALRQGRHRRRGRHERPEGAGREGVAGVDKVVEEGGLSGPGGSGHVRQKGEAREALDGARSAGCGATSGGQAEAGGRERARSGQVLHVSTLNRKPREKAMRIGSLERKRLYAIVLP